MMASNAALRDSRAEVDFRYHTCRNISGPEDTADNRRILAGHAPASSFLCLDDNENVREYLVNRPGKHKASPTLVHRAMRDTLSNRPEMFSILNGGICLVAHSTEIDDNKKIRRLDSPSIINGSQTQGELKRYLAQSLTEEDLYEPSVTFEVIVTNDEDLIADVSISRNYQNPVKDLSIAGRKKQLDALEEAVRDRIPDAKLRKSESDGGDGFLDTEKLIQVLFALTPMEILDGFDQREGMANKVAAYSQKTRCLKLFQKIVENAESDRAKEDYRSVHKCFMDMAGEAWGLYERWKSHQGFAGTGLRAIQRDEKRRVESVPDGIVFPILAALSAFVAEKNGHWKYAPPSAFDEKELISAAKDHYIETAKSNPQTMGKMKASYSTLHRITTIYAKMAEVS
ncbi:MAG: AIPR family protein [Planctomycetales bacterium]|nr:AIPR family protein [Planctomycetales bacterium]